MQEFRDKLAVVTGAGTGMGRELARQLAAEGCHLALCDVSLEDMAETKKQCEAVGPEKLRVSTHECDVSDESQVVAFRDAVVREHGQPHLDLLFNNAGIAGGGSIVDGVRSEWDRTFAVCWGGVYYCSRAFMPLLVKSEEARIVNTSSVNGFFASLGPGIAHTAYCSAKFAVKGFSEALITDLRLNAPHVKVHLVMPGHVGTSIVLNTQKVHGKHEPKDMTAEEVAEIREQLTARGMPVENVPDDMLRAGMQQQAEDFRDKAPLSAGGAATIILDGVREGRWRILVGDDAKVLDLRVREAPEEAYEDDFWASLTGAGLFGDLGVDDPTAP